MDLEEDYVKYAGQFSLTLLAVSATYFFDPANAYSYGTFLGVTVLFGYTAYISREGFQSSAFLAFAALIFLPLNAQMAATSIVVSFGNVLISFFSKGSSFRSYYGTVSLPMLFTGAILGIAFFYGASLQPEIAEDLGEQFSGATAEKTGLLVEQAEIIEVQQDQQTDMIEDSVTGTVMLTREYVTSETEGELSAEDQQVIIEAFEGAEQNISQEFREETDDSMDDIEMAGQVEKVVQNLIEGNEVLYLAPILAVGLYALHPFIGILTAISAVSFQRFDRKSE